MNMFSKFRVSFAFAPALVAVAIACMLLNVPASLEAQSSADAQIPIVQQGYELPSGLTLLAARGTGRTTGHIAELSVENRSAEPIEVPPGVFFIPATGRFQSYVGRPQPAQPIPPGATVAVPVIGYCATVRLPPVPADTALPPPEEWFVATGETGPADIPPMENAGPPGNALVPGSDIPLPRAISVSNEPLVAAPLLIAALQEIEQATSDLQESGELVTPFSSNPERERQAVEQQVFWIFAAELENEPYTREEFTERLEAQYENNTGIPIGDASDADQQRVQQGADEFWGAFELVGLEAKVINVAGGAAAGEAQKDEVADEKARAAEGTGAAHAEVAPPACSFTRDINHSPRVANVTVADSYGDDESREEITAGIRAAVQSENNAYATATPPSTAYAIWREDHVGGISSGYAKSVFLQKNSQEWVWSTEALSVAAQGTGTHTLSAKHGAECKSLVAGSATLWLKASSDAFDPLENSIEYFRALDAAKEASVKFVTRKLPPGISDGIEAGVDAITDPASDTYASASGNATLTVGGKTDQGAAKNNVVYKREDKEDKAIIGGGESVKKLGATDARPGSLTSKITAGAEMKAGAEGNGYATANLESLYGTILVGVCECPTGTVWQTLTDTSLLIESDAAQAAVNRAEKEMDDASERINADLKSGAQKTDRASLEARVTAELERWAKSIGGDRFEESDEGGE